MKKLFKGLVRGKLIRKRIVLLSTLVVSFLMCFGMFFNGNIDASGVYSANLVDALGVSHIFTRWAVKDNPATSATGFVTFGTFPKTAVSAPAGAPAVNGQVWTAANGEKYLYETNFLGTSPQWFKIEPIKWQILDVDSTNNRLVLMTESNIESRGWDTQEEDNIYWDGSGKKWTDGHYGTYFSTMYTDAYGRHAYPSIRLYLNNYQSSMGYQLSQTSVRAPSYSNLLFEEHNPATTRYYDRGFLEKAFTKGEYTNAIVPDLAGTVTGPSNGTNTNYKDAYGNYDKVRLISYEEAKNPAYGFHSNPAGAGAYSNRLGYATDYSLKDYMIDYSLGFVPWTEDFGLPGKSYLNGRTLTYWYTSSISGEYYEGTYAGEFGALKFASPSSTLTGIRPVITVDMSKLAVVGGTGSTADPYQLKYVTTVTFDANGGTVSPAVRSVNSGNQVGTLPVPTKTGYKFLGWFDLAGTTQLTESTVIIDSVTYYAKWELNSFKILLDGQGATSAGTTEYWERLNVGNFPTETANAAITSISIPSKTGHRFGGYYTEANGAGTKYVSDTGAILSLSNTFTANTTLYAYWIPLVYKVTLNNAGLGDTSTYFEKYGLGFYQDAECTSEASTVTPPSKTGYLFDGYYTGENGTGDKVISSTKALPSPTTFQADTTIYLNLVPAVYKITLDNGTAGGTLELYERYDDKYYSDAECTNAIIKIVFPSKTGNQFDGYYTGENGTGIKYIDDLGNILSENNTFNENKTLYAKWTPFTVSVELDSEGAQIAGTIKYYEKYGVGNFTDFEGTNEITTITKPEKVGYTFSGYYTETGGAGTLIIDSDGTVPVNTTFLSNTKLYAKWMPGIYKITLDDKDASTSGTQEYFEKYSIGNYSDSECTLLLSTITLPEKTGYTFGGYFTEEDGLGDQILNTSGTLPSNTKFKESTTLYAKWIPNIYKVTLDNKDAQIAGTLEYYERFGDLNYKEQGCVNSISKITKPEKTGYKFNGYYTSEGGIGTKCIDEKGDIVSNSSLLSSNTTLYAYWTPAIYEITLKCDDGVISGTQEYFEKYNIGNFEDDSCTTLLSSIVKPQKTGYTFKGYFTKTSDDGVMKIDADGVLSSSTTFTTDTTLYAKWEANTNIPYVVNHYKMNDDKTTYTKEVADTENKTGTSDETVQISTLAKTYDGLYLEGGFLGTITDDKKPASFVNSAKILPDGSLVINIYYTRINPNPPPTGGGGGSSKASPTAKITVVVSTGNEQEDKKLSKMVEDEIKKVLSSDNKITKLPAPVEREGYKYIGLFYDEACTKPVKAGDKILDGTKFYIKWEKISNIKDGFVHYIDGYDDGTFKPNRSVTRAELAKMIAVLSEDFDLNDSENYNELATDFLDIKEDSWYNPYIGYMVKCDVMEGYRFKRFKPEQFVTRAEVCKVLTKVFDVKEVISENKYEKELKGKWYEDYVSTLVKGNLIQGYKDGTFGANKNISREELVTLINRLRGIVITDDELNMHADKYPDLKKTEWFYKDVIIASFDK